MTLKIYMGTAAEITARLSGAPDPTATTVATATSTTVFTLANNTSFSEGDSIVIGREKGEIEDLTGDQVTLKRALKSVPTVGASVRHYDADYTTYRDQGQPFQFVDDLKTGGTTGDKLGQQDLILFDWDGKMPEPVEQNRITIFESEADDTPLFGGVIVSTERMKRTVDQRGGANTPMYEWLIEASGYQWEANGIGIEEQPFTNINAGEFLKYIMNKWTNLVEGEIDTENSPRIDYIRLSNVRRFSDVGQALAQFWPSSEFYIQNGHTQGKVYFRQRTQSVAPIVLSDDYLNLIGNRSDQYVRIRKDYDKVYNIVMLPYYKEQNREPDFHVQTTTADEAFLKTSVTLAGQPASLDESQLLFDDFADGTVDTDFTEDDVTNPSPPTGFNSADGYLVEGPINQVAGLHMLDTSGASPAIVLGDIGRVTDPAEVQPFTGAERQMIYCQELVVNTLGEAVVLGVLDQTSVLTTTLSGSSTSRIYLANLTGFSMNDRIDVGGSKTYITAVGANYVDVSPSITAPGAGVTVTKHRLAKSRIKFGVYFKADGSLKYIKDGVETAFSTPRVYTAGPSTYSLRLFMQSFETVITGSPSSTGVTLDDAANFATGDVVEIYTSGSRSAPERRVITKTGSDISYEATQNVPAAGYRVRTLPKMVLQIKGGVEYGDITGREWTTIYTATNTWQTTVAADLDDHGVIMCIHKSLVATMTLFQMKDPVPITANIGTRYLHIGTQDIDSSEADVDCLIRKVGSHFQLDFFPDTKALWESESILELRYKDRWRTHLEDSDPASIRELAAVRGYTITDSMTEQRRIQLGGKALDSLEISPTPYTDIQAINQTSSILDALRQPAFTVEIVTNTVIQTICKAGQILRSTLPGVPDVEIQRVDIAEVPGAKNGSNRSEYRMTIRAGTVDRLQEIIQKRALASGTRIVIDDGVNDDSYTKLQKTNFEEIAEVGGEFTLEECSAPSLVVYDGANYSALMCLRIT